VNPRNARTAIAPAGRRIWFTTDDGGWQRGVTRALEDGSVGVQTENVSLRWQHIVRWEYAEDATFVPATMIVRDAYVDRNWALSDEPKNVAEQADTPAEPPAAAPPLANGVSGGLNHPAMPSARSCPCRGG
jgi:hypothetical protein